MRLTTTISFILFCFLLDAAAAAHVSKRSPTAVVVGTVYCDTCFRQHSSKNSHFIPGASVAVECPASFRKEVKTDRQGVFRVALPAEVSNDMERIKACQVKLVKSSQPFCAIAAAAAAPSTLRLKSRKQGLHIYSAGFFTFKPLQQPELCYQKPSPTTSTTTKLLDTSNAPLLPSAPPTARPRLFPPLYPFRRPASLPPNPFQPPSLLPPNPFQPPSLLPPLQPSPSLLPPNPLQPPPASIFPPNPFQPPSPPSFGIPGIPGLTPSPPPPGFRFPPLFPFPTNPLFPGIPPAAPSKTSP